MKYGKKFDVNQGQEFSRATALLTEALCEACNGRDPAVAVKALEGQRTKLSAVLSQFLAEHMRPLIPVANVVASFEVPGATIEVVQVKTWINDFTIDDALDVAGQTEAPSTEMAAAIMANLCAGKLEKSKTELELMMPCEPRDDGNTSCTKRAGRTWGGSRTRGVNSWDPSYMRVLRVIEHKEEG